MSVLGQHHVVAVQGGNPDADIVDGSEAERLFNNDGVFRHTLDRAALHKKAVALVLERAGGFAVQEFFYPHDGAREADVFRVRVLQAPLSEQVACIAALLTGEKKEREENYEL